MSECVVHAVEDDVKTLCLSGGEERHSLFIEGVSAMKQGDGGEINRAQFSQTAACCLCRKRFVFLKLKIMKRYRRG